MHLAEIVRCKPTHIGFCDVLGLGAGVVWLNPSQTGCILVLRQPWPLYIISDLVLATNLKGQITNSDIELATLALHEATLLAAAPEARMAVQRSGLENTHTVLWGMLEYSTINPVVTDLLRIRALHSRQFFLNTSIFYHTG